MHPSMGLMYHVFASKCQGISVHCHTCKNLFCFVISLDETCDYVVYNIQYFLPNVGTAIKPLQTQSVLPFFTFKKVYDNIKNFFFQSLCLSKMGMCMLNCVTEMLSSPGTIKISFCFSFLPLVHDN